MAEFEEKLNTLLGDPEAMGQILSIAKALTGEGEKAPESQGPPPPPAEEGGSSPAGPAAPAQTDWSGLLGLLGGLTGGGEGTESPLSALGNLDPRLIQTAVTLFGEYSATDDRKVALLRALKPFLKEERSAKVDKAIQIAKLSRVIRVAFQLFKERGEGDV